MTDAQTDITNGATVLLVDPLDSGVGTSIESYAKSHGVDVIDYDRLTLGGSREYYVSFNNVQVGKLIGEGLVSCVAAWHVGQAPGRRHARRSHRQQRHAVRPGLRRRAEAAFQLRQVGRRDQHGRHLGHIPRPSTEFQEAYTAHPNINAALIPNDETGAPIITYLQTLHIAPKTFPTTGQDATLTGLQNILSGYQCGTVYKPIYLEAQAAAALALYLRAGQTPPADLVNGTTEDTTANVAGPVGAPHAGVGHHGQHELDDHQGQLRAGSSSAPVRTQPYTLRISLARCHPAHVVGRPWRREHDQGDGHRAGGG